MDYSKCATRWTRVTAFFMVFGLLVGGIGQWHDVAGGRPCFGWPAGAQDEAEAVDDPPNVVSDPERPFQVPGWLVEQSIYVPFDKIRDKFEQSGRGVFIPFEQFDALWKAAQAKAGPEPPVEAPSAYTLVSSSSTAKLRGRFVEVESEVVIDFLREGWHEVPLSLGGCSLLDARWERVEGQASESARVTQVADGGFVLLHQSPQARDRRTLTLSYVKAIQEGGGENQVGWTVPQTAINRWVVSIDQTDVDIEVTPAVLIRGQANAAVTEGGAVTESPSGGPESSESPAAGSTVTALLGNAKSIDIRWTPRSVGAEGLAALMTADVRGAISIQKDLVRAQYVVGLEIQRAPVDRVDLELTPGVRVVNVLSESLKRWQVDESQNLVRLELFEPMQGKLQLDMVLEQEAVDDVALEEKNREWLLTPIKVVGATRQAGTLTLESERGLRLEVAEFTGLTRVNQGNGREAESMMFRYSAVPYRLRVEVDEWKTLINARQQVVARLGSFAIDTEAQFYLDIKQRGIFQIPLSVPEGLEIYDVRGEVAGEYQAVSVEKTEPDPEDPRRLNVQLTVEAIGAVSMVVRGRQTLPAPGLVDSDAAPLGLQVLWPRLADGVAATWEGRLLVSAPDSLNVIVPLAEDTRLRSVDPSLVFGDLDAGQQRFAYEYMTPESSLDLQANLRRPRVFVDQVTQIEVESGLLRYRTELDYDVKFSPVRSLRLDVPDALSQRIRIVGGALSYERMEPQPADVAAGYVAWKLSGANELLGTFPVVLAWDVSIPEVAVGAKQVANVQTVQPQEVERKRGQLVFDRSDLFDIQLEAGAKGLRPIDPTADLYGERRVEDAVAALEYVGPWELNVELARYELYDLKRSSVNRSLLRAVWLRNEQLSVQALYRVKSVNQRLVIEMPPGFDAESGFDSNPVKVDGQPLTLERGEEGRLIIPLGNRDRDQELLVELRYTMPLVGGSVPVPTFTEDCAVQKTALIVYLPQESSPLSFSGPWSDPGIPSNQSVWRNLFRSIDADENEWLEWIATSKVSADSLRAFETDGRPFVFTTIQPLAGAKGGLQMTQVPGWWVQTVLVVGLLMLGILLVPMSWTIRLIGVALLVAGWMLFGMLWPFAFDHLDYSLAVPTGLLVVALWIGQSTLVTLRRLRDWWGQRPAVTSVTQSDAAVAAETTPEGTHHDA